MKPTQILLALLLTGQISQAAPKLMTFKSAPMSTGAMPFNNKYKNQAAFQRARSGSGITNKTVSQKPLKDFFN